MEIGDHIEQMMNAVTEIDIGITALTIHNFISPGPSSARCMADPSQPIGKSASQIEF